MIYDAFTGGPVSAHCDSLQSKMKLCTHWHSGSGTTAAQIFSKGHERHRNLSGQDYDNQDWKITKLVALDREDINKEYKVLIPRQVDVHLQFAFDAFVQWFSKVFLSPCSNIHYTMVISQLLMQCRLRDWRSRAFSVGYWPCPLHAEIAPISLNLVIIIWIVNVQWNS